MRAQWMLSEKSILYAGQFDCLHRKTRQEAYNIAVLAKLAVPMKKIDPIAGPRRDHHRNPSLRLAQQPPSQVMTKNPPVQYASGASQVELTATRLKTSSGSERIRSGYSTTGISFP
jgi:hypothetical protein